MKNKIKLFVEEFNRPIKPITFGGHNITFAKDQPEYFPLPAYRHYDEFGTVTFCWSLSWRDRLKLLATGKLWHSVLTFDKSLQPQLLSANIPEIIINKNH